MTKIDPGVRFFTELAKVQAVLTRRLDNGLGGLGLSEFVILLCLGEAKEGKMRRIDLAEAVGLTASGVTRLLLPMEKIGLVRRESNRDDARSSFVLLAPGGKRKLEEGMTRAEELAVELIPAGKKTAMKDASAFLADLAKNIR